MNWKHLIYIIPICLIIGIFIGFIFGFNASDTLIKLTQEIDKCQSETLTYIYSDSGINKEVIDNYYMNCINGVDIND